MSQKPKGLQLDLPGAPLVPHDIPGLAGHYRSDVPTPVGEGELVSVEEAQQAVKDGLPVKLVDIPEGDVSKVRKQAAADRAAASNNPRKGG
jgi:hypothetical protein